MVYQGAPVNDLHSLLRTMSVDAAIVYVRHQITIYGHDAVKRDPGVYAWVMENAKVLSPMAQKGGLRG